MKPLSSFTYIKSNLKKVLPCFICTMLSVFLVYLLGLLLYGSVDEFYKSSNNMVKNCSLVYSNNSKLPINDKIIKEIRNDSNVGDIVPIVGLNNSFGFHAVFGSMGGINSFILYSEDVEKVLKNYNLKLESGTIPKNNADEILLPLEFTKQFKLKVGDYINNDTSPDIHVDKTYKIAGITKGDVYLPIVCDVGQLKREDAAKLGLMFFFKDSKNMALNDKITALKDKNIVTMEYKSIKEEMDQVISSMDFLYFSLDIIILLVLCISLGNLNYIVFLNRRNEYSILATIGFAKSKLKRKLLKENSIVCFLGFAAGIGFTQLIIQLLNITIWQPNGQHIAIWRLSSFLVALIIPFLVSLFSMMSSVREFNKLSYESLNI